MPVTRSNKNAPGINMDTPASPSTADSPLQGGADALQAKLISEAGIGRSSTRTAHPASTGSLRMERPHPPVATENVKIVSKTARTTHTSRRSSIKQQRIAKAKEELAEMQLAESRAATALAQARLARIEAEASSDENEEEDKSVDKSRYVEEWLNKTDQAAPPVVHMEEVHHDARPAAPPVVLEVTGTSPRGNFEPQRIDLKDLVTAFNEVHSPPHASLPPQSCCRAAEAPTKYLYKLPEFYGACEQWINYRDTYRETEHLQTRMQNITRLRQSLKGVARETVEEQFCGGADPDVILELLERRFGRPDMIVTAKIEKLRKLPKCSENPNDICAFSTTISNVVSAIKNLKKESYLDNPEITRTLVDKLPIPLKFSWYKFSSEQNMEEPSLKKLARFMKIEADCCSAYADKEVIKIEKEATKKTTQRAFLTQETSAQPPTSPMTISCDVCKESHKVYECSQFTSKDVNERWNMAKKLNLCFQCLRFRKKGHNCKKFRCGINGCKYNHNRLLHNVKNNKQNDAVVTSVNVMSTPRTFLKILPVCVTGTKRQVNTFALLDEGSTVTLIDDRLARTIGTDGPVEPFTIQAIAGARINAHNSKKVSVKIRGLRQEKEHEMTARTFSNLKLSPQTVDKSTLNACHHLHDVADQLEYKNAIPTLLIGQDNWALTVSNEVKAGPRHLPTASLTKLGWVLHGYRSSHTDETVHFVNNIQAEDDIDKLIKQHFAVESLGVQARLPKNNEDHRALEILERTSRRLPDGRFETGLLWRKDKVKLPSNYQSALSRLHNLEKKLDKDESLKIKYKKQIENLIENGYAEEINSTPPEDRTWYLPHFAVINPSKPKIRIVHDAAAKTHGVCLNDHLLPGPDLLQSLPGVLMRFRQRPVAVNADIKEMFLQIRIRNEDRDALRFLWRGDRREGPPQEYRMTSVIFGAASSPCTAIYIKNKNAEEHRDEEPKAAEAIVRHHYMDDYLQSFDDIKEAKETVNAVIKVHSEAKFHIQKWVSNKPAVLSHLDTSDLQNKEVELDHGLPTEKVLGIMWKPQDDRLSFNLNMEKLSIKGEKKTTKREILRVAMTLFDPLGLATPVTIQAKHLIQELWRQGADWDEEVDDSIQTKWQNWLTQVRRLKEVTIPRCYPFYSEAVHLELHTFVDASEEAYSTAAYWRIVNKDGTIRVCLIAAKGRVAPLKLISIPRLELQAAILGSRLAKTIEEEHDKKPSKRYFWSDSKTVLTWIRTGHRSYKPFVAHRIAEIEELTKTKEWRWVPSRDNVADDATRRTPEDFDIHHRWFNGPEFLYLEETHWPTEDDAQRQPPTGEERVLLMQLTKQTTEYPLPKIDRFSSWLRLIRATARVLQAIELMKRKKVIIAVARKRTKKNDEKDSTWKRNQKKKVSTKKMKKEITERKFIQLEANHIRKAEQLWISKVQNDSFGNEIAKIKKERALPNNSRLSALSIIIDEENRLRLRSRVDKIIEVERDQKHPIILDGDHPYVKLYIDWMHQKLHHAGTETVINEVRQHFWILRLRTTTRNIVRSCFACRIRKSKPTIPATGDLPRARLSHHQRPFSFVGFDYFGPLGVTIGRQHHKRYVALFTCLTTRAVHLEVAASLSTASAICALRRMIARRGCPTEIFSDNGTNFHGADHQLQREAMEAAKEEATNRRIKWSFIPAGAPFMGGAWERLVQSVKRALSTTLHEKYPPEEVLTTLLAEVENSINSRPLTHVSSSPEDPEAITPNHFLLGGSSRIQELGTFDDADLVRRDQWRHSQRLADTFWKRWIREYLPTLQDRRETKDGGPAPDIGDVVLIVDENLPRNTWPRGRITARYPGQDGITRVVDIQTQGGILRRPVRKIVALPK